MYVGIFYLVFSQATDAGLGEISVSFLLCGQIPYMWFSRTVTNSMDSIFSAGVVCLNHDVPPYVFTIATIFQDALKTGFVYATLIMFMCISDEAKSLQIANIFPVLLVTGLLVASAALFSASIIPFYPDLRFLISSGLILLLFVSGVFYSPETIGDERLRLLLDLNPLSALIEAHRAVLLEGAPPDVARLGIVASVSISIFALNVAFLDFLRDAYIRRM